MEIIVGGEKDGLVSVAVWYEETHGEQVWNAQVNVWVPAVDSVREREALARAAAASFASRMLAAHSAEDRRG